jgi:hypothetical protein
MIILLFIALVLVGHSALLRGSQRLLKWPVFPARYHAIALIAWFTSFAFSQAAISSALPNQGGVHPAEIWFVVLCCTLCNFLALRVLYRQEWFGTAVVATLQSALFVTAGYLVTCG